MVSRLRIADMPVRASSVPRPYLSSTNGFQALTGYMQASTPEQVFDNICRADYALPDSLSYEAQDLIAGLLQTVRAVLMDDRITPIHSVLESP